MFNNVVVGVDGTQGGRDAIVLAKHLLGEGGELTLAYVFPGDTLPSRGSNSTYDAAQRDRVLELLETAREEAGVAAQLRSAGSPSVGHGLHVLAESTDADLLIVGSSQRGLLGRALIGDDTRAALNGAPCAVAIAPTGYAQEASTIREIGIAYNGSPESEHALAVGRRLAAESGAVVSAFEAVALPAYQFFPGPQAVEESIKSLTQGARDRIAALGGVEPHAAYGVPAEELALYSASLDLLIVGSRDYGPIGRIVYGSTARRLARMARCPLLVLTRGSRTAELAVDEAVLQGVVNEL
jgi:nucleotide-binding universal stress UspA family protein